MDNITQTDIKDIIDYFSRNYYRNRDNSSKVADVLKRCEVLFRVDYRVETVLNQEGELSNSYPPKMFVPVECLTSTDSKFKLSLDLLRLRDTMSRARVARCRTRFPIPIMLYKDKFICRSSTLSSGPEIYTRKGMDYLFNTKIEEDSFLDEDDNPTSSDWKLSRGFDQVRTSDIKLLKLLDVKVICDLMVENKKVKYGVNVTSSEKIDKEKRYQDFTLVSMPYPGCEFFKSYRDHCYDAKGLVFDWSQSFVDAKLGLPKDAVIGSLGINWSEYKNWDLITLTQNYLKLILKYIIDGHNGVLVHCISGWDRTPLYVSLLRLSLWADGKMHPTLSPCQILYLTLAYDWFLFGHNLVDRLSKGEEILCFCFYMLSNITSQEFSAQVPLRERRNNSGSEVDPSQILLETSPRNSRGAAESDDEEGIVVCDDDDEDDDDYIPPTLTNSAVEELPNSPNHNSTSLSRLGEPIPVPSRPGFSVEFPSLSSSSGSSPPVLIPPPYKQRSESTSSSSSWQVLSLNDSPFEHPIHSPDQLNRNVGRGIAVSEPIWTQKNADDSTPRAHRLKQVQELFYDAYFKTPLMEQKSREWGGFSALFDRLRST